MTPLHYAKAIRTGLIMAEKARYEGGYRAACMLDALGRGDWRSAKSHWLMVELWVSQVDSINRLTLEMCRASRMPICGGETTRYEREEQVFGSTVPVREIAGVEPTNAEPVSAPVDSGSGDPSRAVTPLPPGPRTEAALSPSYFPPVLRP